MCFWGDRMQQIGCSAFIKNEAGGALLLVVGVVLILAVLAAAGLGNVVIMARITDNQQKSVVLQYLAEAGVARMRAELALNPNLVNLANSPDAEDARFDFNLSSEWGEAMVTSVLKGPDTSQQLLIYSTASLPAGSRKSLLVKIKPPYDQVRASAYSEVNLP